MAEINGDDFDSAAPDLGSKYYEFEISNISSPRSKDVKGSMNVKSNNQQQNNQAGNNNANNLVPLNPASNSAPAAKLEPIDIDN